MVACPIVLCTYRTETWQSTIGEKRFLSRGAISKAFCVGSNALFGDGPLFKKLHAASYSY